MYARGRPQRRQRFFCRVPYLGGRWDLTIIDTLATGYSFDWSVSCD
jgi:hypothetical protein